MRISELVEYAHSMAVEKGFHDDPVPPATQLLLIVSEITEGFEELRSGHGINEVYHAKGGKPEGLPIELADAVIRIADFCGRHGIDLERAVVEKLAFNSTRPHKHGKEF